VKPFAKLEATYLFGQKLELEAGARLGDEFVGYGLLSAYVSEQLAIQGFAGKDYHGAGLKLSF
jgi:hypothetical protein